jgi:hypothetical protein
MNISPADREVLRDLARRVAEIAALPVQAERIALWNDFNRLQARRPMVLAFPEGGWRDLLSDDDLDCVDEAARKIEWQLRRRVFEHERIDDDKPEVAVWHVPVAIRYSGMGVAETLERPEEATGAYRWDPPIKEPADLEKLRVSEVIVDWEQTERCRAGAEELFGDILEVRVDVLRPPGGQFPARIIKLRGLEQAMMDMYDHPEVLHRLNEVCLESAERALKTLQHEGALRSNAKPDDYCGSGGCGCTDLLPGADQPDPLRPADLWGFAESQDFAAIGPDQMYEFAIQYQAKIMRHYAFCYYGCCEALHMHLDRIIEHIPNLRAVSIAPWCDREIAAETLADRYLYYWKPNPTMTCTPKVDWDHVEAETRKTLEIARGCNVAMVLKDTHTFQGDAERPGRWVRIARRLAEQAAAGVV